MAQFLHQQRADQAMDTELALKLLENVVETGIAGICRARALFPQAFFKTFRTAGGLVSRFDMDVLLHTDNSSICTSLNQQMHVGSQEGLHVPFEHLQKWNTTEWNRFRAEAIILLEWIRCGALQVMREGKLARLTFGIHLAHQNNTADTLTESYNVSEQKCTSCLLLITFYEGMTKFTHSSLISLTLFLVTRLREKKYWTKQRWNLPLSHSSGTWIRISLQLIPVQIRYS